MTLQEEKHALVNYLLTVKPGPVIEDIIKQRLTTLENKANKTIEPKLHMALLHGKTGNKYKSIKEAAKDLGVSYWDLQRDVKGGLFRFRCYPL